MQRLLRLAVAAAPVAIALSAHAGVINAKFSGTVQSQANAGYVVASPIMGEFVYDIGSARYLSFTIGGQSIAAGYSSTADLTPDLYTALYRAQLSPLQLGVTMNSTFTVDLEALNTPWPASGAIALLTNATQLAGNLDTVNSSFGFYTANANGTNIRSVTAMLNGLQVTAVPEPTSLALVLAAVTVLGIRQARRHA